MYEIYTYIYIPRPSISGAKRFLKGANLPCFKGFIGTPWKVLVYLYIYIHLYTFIYILYHYLLNNRSPKSCQAILEGKDSPKVKFWVVYPERTNKWVGGMDANIFKFILKFSLGQLLAPDKFFGWILDPFLLGFGRFSGAVAVGFRECI